MSEPLVTGQDLTDMMERFGNEACLKAQSETHAVFPGGWLPPSVVMALGARETELQNICGGAVLVNGVWQQAYTDRGWLQISDTLPDNAHWLSTIPGCPNGPDDKPNWDPDMAGFHAGKTSALTPMHCPTFTAALGYTLAQFEANRAQAYAAKVKSPDVLRFIVAAHNAGETGALEGYNSGNVDQFTTHSDYSAWVLEQAPLIAEWIAARPNWQLKP